ncbi:hypothetical protein [Caballeronia insecticola]|uniref:Putative secreted protein n=1 Tax=Caballeronia insecticola TaxID=758793 RepID=R4X0A1_9BURK|nr:hypothetical protein [Caballeronia insecticola]BAN27585.1 putative secreted protein [Caballeronia insecticola]
MQSISTNLRPRNALRVLCAMNLAALLAMSTGCVAQAQPEAPPAPPVAATGMPPPPPPPGMGPAPRVEDGAAVTAQATVARFLINPDGDVDGFLTSDGALVRFPPHMSAQLTSAIHTGDNVQINGWRDAGGNLKAQRITDAKSGQQLIDQPPQPGAQPMPRELRGAGLARLSAQGQVAHITTAPRGEPDGVILADGTVIRLTPPVAQQFASLVRTGAKVSAQGYGTRNQYGTALQATAFGSPGNLTRLYDRAPPSP